MTEREQILNWRQQWFATPQTRKNLADLLHNMGLFVTADEMKHKIEQEPGAINGIVQALGILETLHVWGYDSFLRLIDALAAFPVPISKEDQTDGKVA